MEKKSNRDYAADLVANGGEKFFKIIKKSTTDPDQIAIDEKVRKAIAHTSTPEELKKLIEWMAEHDINPLYSSQALQKYIFLIEFEKSFKDTLE